MCSLSMTVSAHWTRGAAEDDEGEAPRRRRVALGSELEDCVIVWEPEVGCAVAVADPAVAGVWIVVGFWVAIGWMVMEMASLRVYLLYVFSFSWIE